MALEYQQPVIQQGGGLTNLTVSTGTCADTYTGGNTIQKTTLHYKAWIKITTFDALFTFFSDAVGTGLGEITLVAGMIYEIEMQQYGGKIKNKNAGSNALYEIWWMQ